MRVTREVVEHCHALGDITVEGELGTVSGVEDQVRVAENEAELCDPARSLEYVERSGVDLFAPAIGTAHGVYMTENPKIDFDRFEKIQQMVNGQRHHRSADRARRNGPEAGSRAGVWWPWAVRSSTCRPT